MTRRAWRIVKSRHGATAFQGEGARLYGGRWNSPGTRVVYASGTRALAALETLVHLIPAVTFRFVTIPIDFDEGMVEAVELEALPVDWADHPPSPSTKSIGDQWAKARRSAVLEIPSAIIPNEPNYLINPGHPDFAKMVIGQAEPFSFDQRLL